jgi:hypothetical protein
MFVQGLLELFQFVGHKISCFVFGEKVYMGFISGVSNQPGAYRKEPTIPIK